MLCGVFFYQVVQLTVATTDVYLSLEKGIKAGGKSQDSARIGRNILVAEFAFLLMESLYVSFCSTSCRHHENENEIYQIYYHGALG